MEHPTKPNCFSCQDQGCEECTPLDPTTLLPENLTFECQSQLEAFQTILKEYPALDLEYYHLGKYELYLIEGTNSCVAYWEPSINRLTLLAHIWDLPATLIHADQRIKL